MNLVSRRTRPSSCTHAIPPAHDINLFIFNRLTAGLLLAFCSGSGPEQCDEAGERQSESAGESAQGARKKFSERCSGSGTRTGTIAQVETEKSSGNGQDAPHFMVETRLASSPGG